MFLDAGEQKLDPVRIQKGLFILSMKSPPDLLVAASRYEFEPYNYGPFAKQIYADLDALHRKGYITTDESWNRSWKFYSVTEQGRERARAEAQSMDARLVEYMAAVRSFVTERSFRELLDAVYQEFPKYAVNSVFQR